jgi:ribosomal protein S18 acetylase RimI-like enzyme
MMGHLLAQASIRKGRRSDLPSLEWNGAYSHFRRLYREIYEGVERGEALIWVAETPMQGIIGQMFVQLVSSRTELADGAERAYIYGFRIKPEYRGQGLGTMMLDAAEDDLLRRGYLSVVLNVNQDNHEARLLYERLGYLVIAPEPGRWSYTDDLGVVHQVNEPAWRMEKKLR